MTTQLTRLPRLLVAAGLLACSGNDLGPRIPAAVVVTPATPRVFVGSTLQLTAAVVDASGQEIPGEAVTFRSSEVTVLTVDDAGLLTSVGSTGTSLITAASGDLTAEVEAEVVWPPSAVVVNPRTLDLDTGEQVALFFTVTDQNGEPVPNAGTAFEGSNPSIVRVAAADGSDEFVLVTGLEVGGATVTLSSGSITAEVPVTVAQHPPAAGITPSRLVFTSSSGSQQVTAALLDRTGDEMEPPEPFTWSSSDGGVAAVGPTGMVTILGTGSAVITATTDTFTARLGVFVGTPPAAEMLARVPFTGANGLAVTADGRYFITGLQSYAAGALPDFAFSPERVFNGPLPDVAVSDDGTSAYIVRQSGGTVGAAVFIVGLTEDSPSDVLPVSPALPSAVAVSPDDSRLIIGNADGFEARRLPEKAQLGATTVGPIDKVTPHPSRPFFYASGANGVFEIDAESGQLARRFRSGPVSHAVSPDGTRLYTVNPGGGIGVWNLETGAEERGLGTVSGTDLVVSPDGRFLYVIYGSDHIVGGSRLYIVDRASGALLREVVLGGVARRVEMSGDGTAVITNQGEGDGWVDFVR
jgi:uncharacterized protein YjdB